MLLLALFSLSSVSDPLFDHVEMINRYRLYGEQYASEQDPFATIRRWWCISIHYQGLSEGTLANPTFLEKMIDELKINQH